jgi:predicted nucleotidyltransferase
MGQAYLDTETSISQAENASSPAFASATANREILSNTPATDKDISSDQLLKESISPLVRELLMDAHSHNSLIHPNDFSLLLHYKLLNLPKEQLVDYLEVSDDFANKLIKNLNHFESFTHFANLLWTKDTTYARICRNLMNIILDIKNDTWDVHQPVPYARVLGFRKNSSALLSEIKKKSAIPLITKLADADKTLSSNAYHLLELDMKSAHIYDSVMFQKSNLKQKHETQKQLIIL